MLQRALFQLFLIAVLATSGAMSFRLPASWTELPSRIEPPTQLDQDLASFAGEQGQQLPGSQGSQGPHGDVAIVVQDVIALLRSDAAWLIVCRESQPWHPLSVQAAIRARAPPRFVG